MALHIEKNSTNKIQIILASDLDQLREKWVGKPAEYITSVYPDKDGERIVITARGRVFVAPCQIGPALLNSPIRAMSGTAMLYFHQTEKKYFVLSDESNEFEFISMPSNGIGSHRSLTSDGEVLRYGRNAFCQMANGWHMMILNKICSF